MNAAEVVVLFMVVTAGFGAVLDLIDKVLHRRHR